MIDKLFCSGCSACVDKCPNKCIKMVLDKEGFYYPEIDEEKCTNCGLCTKVCPSEKTKSLLTNNIKKSYLCINKDEYHRKLSSSGGFFKLLAEYVIEHNGVVCGAAFDEKFNVKHQFAHTNEECYPLMGSKYVQSQLDHTFILVREYLQQNKLVLFAGTSCQAAGLKKYLEKDYDNLIIMDLFCHGTPSPGVWQKYLDVYHRNRHTIKYLSFRNKNYGWWQFAMRIQYEREGSYFKQNNKMEDPFWAAFQKNYIIRPICYKCPYKQVERVSDFTVGDAWNVNSLKANIDDDKGISTVTVNSHKAEKIFLDLQEKMHYFEIDLQQGVLSKGEVLNSNKLPKDREQFFIKLNKNFKKTLNKYTNTTKFDLFIKRLKSRGDTRDKIYNTQEK